MLVITGLVAVYSASFVQGLAYFNNPEYYVIRQAIWAVLGTILLVGAMRTDYRMLRKLAVPLMIATLVVLVAVVTVGTTVNGAQRWLGYGPFTLQPAEFAKLSVIVYIAAWLASKGDNLRSWSDGFIPFVIIIGMVAALILLQPSLGTTLIICTVAMVMFFVAGATWTQVITLCGAGMVAVVILATAAGYRMDRLTGFFDSEDTQGHAFQTLQSVQAMGNGGVTGLGLGASRGKFFYIPESHTDGVFAIIGEEMGFVATSALLLLFIILLFRGLQIARRCGDDFGVLVATGITTWIAVQMILNLGGITRLIPLTGVPLPFLSFGGSALAAVMLAMGVLVSISRFAPVRSAIPAPARTTPPPRQPRPRRAAARPRPRAGDSERPHMTFPRRPW